LPQSPVQNSCQFPKLTAINSGTVNPILCCNCQLSRCHLFSYIVSIIFNCRFSTDSKSSSILAELICTTNPQLTQLSTQLAWGPFYIASGRTQQNTVSNDTSIVRHCRGNMFTEPLPSNGPLLWLHYPGHVTICINISQTL
jgi:hypothetical protein